MPKTYDLDDTLRHLLQTKKLKNQADIQSALRAQGIPAKQPTISRALQRLNATKVLDSNGEAIYRIHINMQGFHSSLIREILNNGQLVIIKTSSGAANHVAEILDTTHIDGIAGTVAGDNTLFIAPLDVGRTQELQGKIEGVFGVK